MKYLPFIIIPMILFTSIFFTNCKKQSCDCQPQTDTIKISSINHGLIDYLPFSGNANDSSGNGHNGKILSASLTTNRFGTPNSAYAFYGDSSAVKTDDAVDLRLGNTDFTISAWIFKDSVFNTHNAIISKRNTGSKTGYLLSIDKISDSTSIKTVHINFQVSGGSDPKIISKSKISLFQWHHIVIQYVFKTNTIYLYVNNKLDMSLTNFSSPNPTAGSALLIGNDAVEKPASFHGKIDDIRIYNRVLSASEITKLFNLTY